MLRQPPALRRKFHLNLLDSISIMEDQALVDLPRNQHGILALEFIQGKAVSCPTTSLDQPTSTDHTTTISTTVETSEYPSTNPLPTTKFSSQALLRLPSLSIFLFRHPCGRLGQTQLYPVFRIRVFPNDGFYRSRKAKETVGS